LETKRHLGVGWYPTWRPEPKEKIMIFAELLYDTHYNDTHDEIEALLRCHFPDIECGFQCDSHFTIRAADTEVRVDTFSCMRHEVKSRERSDLVEQVIGVLETRYRLTIFDPPKFEGDEPEYEYP
jgi:hypothetical protein